MAGSKENMKAVELWAFVKENFPGYYVITSTEYDKGAFLVDKNTGDIVDAGASNYKLAQKISVAGYAPPKKWNGLGIVEPNIEARVETELMKLQNRIQDAVRNARMWAMGNDVTISKNRNGEYLLKVGGKPVTGRTRKSRRN